MSRRVLAVAAVFVGAVIVGFNPDRWDTVILAFPVGGHGIHLHDAIGMALITLGVIVLWRSGNSPGPRE